MKRLLINRIPLSFKCDTSLFMVVKPTAHFVLNKNRAGWIRDKLPDRDSDAFVGWMDKYEIQDSESLSTEFKEVLSEEDDSPKIFSAELKGGAWNPFKREIFKQELSQHLQRKGLFVNPAIIPLDMAVFELVAQFDDEYDQYRRMDFLWNPRKEELSLNFGSEKTLVTKNPQRIMEPTLIFDTTNMLAYRSNEATVAKSLCPREVSRKNAGPPLKFSYKDRYKKLKEFAADNLYDFESPWFHLGKTGLKNVQPDDLHNVYSQQNLMTFANDKTAINAVIGMREYGPLKKAENSEKKRLLFIYQNRNDANTLYRYLKNGLKHFPGLLSYVGIPVALAQPEKGLSYSDAIELPNVLSEFLTTYYPNDLYPDTLAVVIGPFKKYESDENESKSYYEIKKTLLDKGIASQFVSTDTLNNYGVHYSLPNIAIAILAKFGGVPWKLAKKKNNELVVGFNTKLADRIERQYLGSAVFFDNEGRLGGIKGLPVDRKDALIEHLKAAITEYTDKVGVPDRLVIHYYKPARRDEIRNIVRLLEGMALAIPVAVVEVNDSKSKLDICFDADYDMGMPESGAFIKIGFNEYLLFNNNRYQKNPPRNIDDELPIKLKLSYVNTGGFNSEELIAQVYEFSRLNWKGLKQRSVPVSTTYSKTIAEFSSHFGGEIPQNDVANNIPWFI